MNSTENIKNAFDVVIKTYENIDKLMRYCDAMAPECNYLPCTENYYLRYRSDKYYIGWLVSSFTKLYQSYEDGELENEWLDGPIFGINIFLIGEPKIYLAKYEFDSIEEWNFSYFSSAAYWLFEHPLHVEKYGYNFELKKLNKKDLYFVSQPRPDHRSKDWKLDRIVFTSIDLTSITSENVTNLIFNEFGRLRDL